MTGASAICVTQQGRELRTRTLPPDPGPILSAPRAGVDEPFLATFSAADRALGWWYPTASLLSHSDSENAQDLTYRWGAMGHDGYLAAGRHGDRSATSWQALYLRKNSFLQTQQRRGDRRRPITGQRCAHCDIRHPEVVWAILAAALT